MRWWRDRDRGRRGGQECGGSWGGRRCLRCGRMQRGWEGSSPGTCSRKESRDPITGDLYIRQKAGKRTRWSQKRKVLGLTSPATTSSRVASHRLMPAQRGPREAPSPCSSMAREIKFTPFGVPYVPEFDNVSFVPERPASRSSSSSSFCYIESPPPSQRFPAFSLRSASSLFKRRPTQPIHPPAHDHDLVNDTSKPLPPPPKLDVSEPNGIYIRFPPDSSQPCMSRKQGLVLLQQTISAAVLDAGMSRSPGNMSHPECHSSDNQARGCRSADALFCGTYGQMMAALEGAGLSATPCTGEDLPGRGYSFLQGPAPIHLVLVPLQTDA